LDTKIKENYDYLEDKVIKVKENYNYLEDKVSWLINSLNNKLQFQFFWDKILLVIFSHNFYWFNLKLSITELG